MLYLGAICSKWRTAWAWSPSRSNLKGNSTSWANSIRDWKPSLTVFQLWPVPEDFSWPSGTDQTPNASTQSRMPKLPHPVPKPGRATKSPPLLLPPIRYNQPTPDKNPTRAPSSPSTSQAPPMYLLRKKTRHRRSPKPTPTPLQPSICLEKMDTQRIKHCATCFSSNCLFSV